MRLEAHVRMCGGAKADIEARCRRIAIGRTVQRRHIGEIGHKTARRGAGRVITRSLFVGRMRVPGGKFDGGRGVERRPKVRLLVY